MASQSPTKRGASSAAKYKPVRERSPPKRAAFSPADHKTQVFQRLLENKHLDALTNPEGLKAMLAAHFDRLPPSYQMDANLHRPKDVLIHQRVLAEAKDPKNRPVFHLEEQTPDLRRSIQDTEYETEVRDGISSRRDVTYTPIHQIVFSTLDKPKVLSQVSTLLSDIELNIRETHVFLTTDGYSLGVFVADGWPYMDAESLLREIRLEIDADEESCLEPSDSSAIEKLQDLHPKDVLCDIDKDMLKIGDKIALGAFGDLYCGKYMGQDVAIKILRLQNVNGNTVRKFDQEVSILRKVQHRNIVRYIGAYRNLPAFCILTEYMPGGNLYDFLHGVCGKLKLSVLLRIALDICQGMDYLHQNNIVHGDLRTHNLLFDSNDVIKVADFGVAWFQNQGGPLTVKTQTYTYRWMAPEMINQQPCDKKADVFSFGIVLWELTTMKIPYGIATPTQVRNVVRQGLRPEISDVIDPVLLDLMQRCWGASPSRRPTFPEIIVKIKELLKQIRVLNS